MSGTNEAKVIRSNEAELEEVGLKKHYWYSKPGMTATQRLNYIRVTLPPGEGHDFHHHPLEEVLHIISGDAEQWIGEKRYELTDGDALHVPPGVVHATFNRGTTELEFIAVLVSAEADFQGEMTVEVGEEKPWKSLRA